LPPKEKEKTGTEDIQGISILNISFQSFKRVLEGALSHRYFPENYSACNQG